MKVRITAIFLCLMMLAGCSASNGEKEQKKSDIELSDMSEQGKISTVTVSDGKFSLKYNASAAFNPLTCENSDNLIVSQLMYEPLFTVTDDFSFEKVLCDSYTVSFDGCTWVFRLLPDVLMTDGDPLTAEDVAYSIDRARESNRFYGRLRNISAVSINENGLLTIDLYSPDFYLPLILDIPIFRVDTAEDDVPVGTGPYVFSEDRLSIFPQYRASGDMPVATVYLRAFDDPDITEAFASGQLDLLWDDPYDNEGIMLRSDHEVRMCDTLYFQYIGVNRYSAIMGSRELRKIISLALDREYIAGEVYGGNAVASPTLCHPSSWMYSELPKDTETIETLEKKLIDFDKDGWLDMPDHDGEWYDIDMHIAVYEDSREKLNAAQALCDSLKQYNIRCSVVPLGWNDYLDAVENNYYELYYAEVLMPANFNFTRILLNDGALSFDYRDDSEYQALTDSYNGASNDSAKITAMKELCEYARSDVPIIPVLYRRCVVHTMRNVVYGIDPSPSNVFYHFDNWTLELTK